MNPDTQQKIPTNVARRAVGLTLCFAPLLALLGSLAAGLIHPEYPRFSGAGFMIGALFLALLNLLISFGRPIPFVFRSTRNVSVIPLIGTVLICIGLVVGFGAIGTAVMGIVAFALDTGSTGWFVICTWKDRSLWDAA